MSVSDKPAQTVDDILFRLATESDFGRLMDIWWSSSCRGHPFLTDQLLLEQSECVVTTCLPAAETWVAGTPLQVTGFIGLLGTHVGALFVEPGRRGVGRLLVEHAGRLRGELTVDVYEANAVALGFYERLSFVPISKSPHDDEGRNLPMIRMLRPAVGSWSSVTALGIKDGRIGVTDVEQAGARRVPET